MKPWHVAVIAFAALLAVPLVEAALLMPVVGRTTAQACIGVTRFVAVPVPFKPTPVPGGTRL